MMRTTWNLLCYLLIPCFSALSFAKDYNIVSSKHKTFYPKHKHDILYDNKVIPEDTEIDVFIYRHQIQSALSFAKDYNIVSSKHKTFYPKHKHDILYDNKVIPEDTEIDVFIYRHQIQILYFMLEGSYRPISVTVTPCSSDVTLEWKISHSSFQNAGSPGYTSGTWSNHVIRPPSSSPAAAYVGRQRRSYTNPRAPSGLYTLEFRADDDAKAKVFITTRPTGQMPFHPPLPPESGVQIVKIKRNRILISWKPSLSGRPVEYCVSSNNRGNYNSLCSASGDVYGSSSYPLLHSSSYHHSSSSMHHEFKNDASLTCVGRKTWHLFKNLQRGRTYYFDVFVLDLETNASSTYVGVRATVRNVARHPSRLKDDSLVTFTLDANNGYTVHTKYHPGKSDGPILLFIQSCTGPGPVTLQISQNAAPRQEIFTESVMDVKTLEVPKQMSATANSSKIYSFSVRSATKHNRKVRLWISGKKHAFPFPVLPQDKSVSVFDTLTTCDSITIGWKASPDEKVKYCIYRQAAFDELMQRTLTEPQNFCEQSTEGSSTRHTVLCRRYHKFSKRRFNDVIMQRVRGLHPGTTYLFEVQVTKAKGRMLPYEQVWATTHDNCSNLRTKR